MHSTTRDIFDKEILTTRKKPLYFYVTVSLWSILLVLFIVILNVRDLDKDSTVSAVLIFFFFVISIYLIFGRYLASITFYDHKIEVHYLFPWNKEIEFKFDKLVEIEFKEFDFLDRLTRSWYRGGHWLYLKNGIGQVCQFKYSINSSENERFLDELQKRCSSNIIFS